MTINTLLTKTAGDMVAESLRSAQIIAAEQSINQIDYQNGLDALNNVLKQLQTHGLHLWAQERAVLPLIKGQKRYILSSSGAKCGFSDKFGNTTLSKNYTSGDTTLDVGSTSDMSVGDEIGIELDDETRQWETVSTIVDSDTVTISSGLNSSASSGNTVYFFTDQVVKPLRLDNVTYASDISAMEIPCERWARQEYMEQTDKDTEGMVVNWYFSPRQSDGELYVWQTASSVQNVLRFDVRKPLSVYTNISDELQIPEEYFLALKWGIAAELGPEYGVKMQRQQLNESKAVARLEEALDNDSEKSSVYFVPDFE